MGEEISHQNEKVCLLVSSQKMSRRSEITGRQTDAHVSDTVSHLVGSRSWLGSSLPELVVVVSD